MQLSCEEFSPFVEFVNATIFNRGLTQSRYLIIIKAASAFSVQEKMTFEQLLELHWHLENLSQADFQENLAHVAKLPPRTWVDYVKEVQA